MAKKSMAGTAKESAKAIIKKMWEKTPEVIKNHNGSAIIVALAASVLTAPVIDEMGKKAVKDMAQELSYTWDPFDGFIA